MTTSMPAKDRRAWTMSMVGLVLLYLVGIGVIVITAAAVGGNGSTSGGPTAGKPIKVTLTEFKIDGNLNAPEGNVVLDVTNAGTMEHNLTVEGTGKTTKLLPAGSSETLSLGNLKAGSYTISCSVPGHKDSGMVATLTVGGSGSDNAGMDMGGSAQAGGTPDYKQMDKDMLASFSTFPAKTKGEGNQVLVPTVLPDGTKQFELTAKIAKWEIEPGKIVDAWTYNGTVPAPMIKLNVGDHIKVLFHNNLPINQDIHWHGIEVPFDMDGVAPITQKPVAPNGDFTYEFTVDRPYQGMYHPHLHGQTTVPNGMFGVFQVGDTPIAKGVTVSGTQIPADVKPAADIPMVLNDSGVIGLSLNGKSFPATAPIVVKQGEWVAITYYNEGVQSHPMHLHQFPQLVTARDGIPLDQPYWVDTLLVAPGERYTVMFQADKVGTWAFHCHILTHAERATGMFGMVTAVVVQ